LSVLEPKRLQELALGLGSIKIESHELVEALFTLDPFVLDEETLTKILLVCPNSEDEKTLRQNEDKLADLTPYEQYIYELMKVPRLKQRIECLLFNYRFDIEFIELNKTLENINEALQAI
jgi:diaphanous 1